MSVSLLEFVISVHVFYVTITIKDSYIKIHGSMVIRTELLKAELQWKHRVVYPIVLSS